MAKLLAALLSFFTYDVLKVLLPSIVNAEKVGGGGLEKRSLVMRYLENEKGRELTFISPVLSSAGFPWERIVPVVIDAIVKILNIVFGHRWLEEVEEASDVPRVD